MKFCVHDQSSTCMDASFLSRSMGRNLDGEGIRKINNRYTIVPAPLRIELNTIKYQTASRIPIAPSPTAL